MINKLVIFQWDVCKVRPCIIFYISDFITVLMKCDGLAYHWWTSMQIITGPMRHSNHVCVHSRHFFSQYRPGTYTASSPSCEVYVYRLSGIA